jgi:hypothetical protein
MGIILTRPNKSIALRAARPMVIASFLAASLAWASPAAASHDWEHYRKVWKPNGSDYKAFAYTDSDMNNDRVVPWKSDYLWARIQVFRNGSVIRKLSAACGPLASGCERTITQSVIWPQTSSTVQSAHCGYHHVGTRRHEINGILGPCGEVETLIHKHETNVG